MSCTAEQIAEKRRQALERLQQTKATANVIQTTPNTNNAKTVQPTTHSNQTTSPGTFNISFYGNASNEKTKVLNHYEDKLKQEKTPIFFNRISSQPYPREGNTSHNAQSKKSTNNNVSQMSSAFTRVTCTCSMISSKRFQVIQSGYHAKLIDIFKSIPTRSYGK